MKYIMILLILCGCATPTKFKVGDCFSYHTFDLTYGTGWDVNFDLQIYEMPRLKSSDGKYRDYIFFRPIVNDRYKKEVNKNPKKGKFISETTGLIWMHKKEFQSIIYDPDNNLSSTGWAKFSYGEGTRNGITCNEVGK